MKQEVESIAAEAVRSSDWLACIGLWLVEWVMLSVFLFGVFLVFVQAFYFVQFLHNSINWLKKWFFPSK